jgi:hypothetical protein
MTVILNKYNINNKVLLFSQSDFKLILQLIIIIIIHAD